MLFYLFLIISLAPQERLEYDIKYGPVVLGSMVLERLGPESLDGKRYERLRAEVEIDEHLSWIFWAKYKFESWCDADNWLTSRSSKWTREKNYEANWSATFDQENKLARYDDGKEIVLPDSCRDMLTLWFYLRRVNWYQGETLVINSHIDRRNWQVRFITSGKQRVRTKAGEFDCLIVSPATTGPLGTVFISEDKQRLPVVIRTRAGGLTVSAYLRKIKRSL
ncbi:MAG: DUF3108 domain-containing protein [candidate division WOR-3 bacterium]